MKGEVVSSILTGSTTRTVSAPRQPIELLIIKIVAEGWSRVDARRGKKLSMSDESPRKGRVESVAVPLTQGKVNAVRAAFKAGVTPSRIARQFGISQLDVWKTLGAIHRSELLRGAALSRRNTKSRRLIQLPRQRGQPKSAAS